MLDSTFYLYLKSISDIMASIRLSFKRPVKRAKIIIALAKESYGLAETKEQKELIDNIILTTKEFLKLRFKDGRYFRDADYGYYAINDFVEKETNL